MEIWHIGSLATLEKIKQNGAQIAWLSWKKPTAFGGLGGPQTPRLLYSSAYGLRRAAFGRARPTAFDTFQIFFSDLGLIPVYCDFKKS